MGSLSADDFTSPGDRSNLEALRGTEPIPSIVRKLAAPGGERSETWLAKYGRRVRPPSRLDSLIRSCGEVIGLEILPRIYVAPVDEVNAFTAGMDNSPFLVISSAMLESLSYMEVQGIAAHELAHVKSKHVLYHTLAESLATGAQFIAPAFGAGLLAYPIRMLLLSWYRESEASADRAALLVMGDYKAFASLMLNLMGQSGSARAMSGSMTELLQTHPTFEHRLRLAREFYGTSAYNIARAKIIAASTSGALATLCKQCSVMFPRSEPFCPSCGVSWG